MILSGLSDCQVSCMLEQEEPYNNRISGILLAKDEQ